jgi:hypothetical protein
MKNHTIKSCAVELLANVMFDSKPLCWKQPSTEKSERREAKISELH